MKFKGPNSSWGTLLKGHILRITAHRHLIFLVVSERSLLTYKNIFHDKKSAETWKKKKKNMPENGYFRFTKK